MAGFNDGLPNNTTVTRRMKVVDVRKVEMTGTLEDKVTDDEMSYTSWFVTQGEETSNLSDWLDAFEGKVVKVTIEMAHNMNEGAQMVVPDGGK